MNYLNHIAELKRRALKVLSFILFIFVILFYFSNDLYDLIINLKDSNLKLIKNENNISLSKTGNTIIATSITSTLITPLKLSFIISLLISAPYTIYHIWLFVTPGLYKREKKILYPAIFTSLALFYMGICFAYFIICPFTIQFLRNCAPDSVLVMTDMSNILNFILNISFTSGLLFQIPIIILLLLHNKIISISNLVNIRPYIFVFAFVIGMFITPPDVLSQIMVALPICILFECTILISRIKNLVYDIRNKKIED